MLSGGEAWGGDTGRWEGVAFIHSGRWPSILERVSSSRSFSPRQNARKRACFRRLWAVAQASHHAGEQAIRRQAPIMMWTVGRRTAGGRTRGEEPQVEEGQQCHGPAAGADAA